MASASRDRAVCLVVLSLIVAGATIGKAELHPGIGFGAWDFSDSTASAATFDFSPVDVGFTFDGSAPLSEALDIYLEAGSQAGIAVMPAGTTFESVTEAPADPAQYASFVPFYEDRIWVIRTREGHYAKVRYLIPWPPDQFEYVYQDNGSRQFTSVVSTNVTTWGRVKALYR